MRRAALGVLLLASLARPALAQQDDPDAVRERREWNENIRQQRERVEIMRRERRLMPKPPPPTEEQLADERARSAFDDPYLVPGDVVVTRHGFYLYRGTPFDRERQPQDFVAIERRAAGRN